MKRSRAISYEPLTDCRVLAGSSGQNDAPNMPVVTKVNIKDGCYLKKSNSSKGSISNVKPYTQ